MSGIIKRTHQIDVLFSQNCAKAFASREAASKCRDAGPRRRRIYLITKIDFGSIAWTPFVWSTSCVTRRSTPKEHKI